MTTGLDSFSNPATIERMYPFQGLEVLFVIVAVVLWILWHIRYTQGENREYEEAKEHYQRLRLQRVMYRGGTALIAAEQQLEDDHPPNSLEPPLRDGA